MSNKKETSQKEMDALLAIDPTQEELDVAIKDHLESIVLPERATSLPELSDDDDYEEDHNSTRESDGDNQETETLRSIVNNEEDANIAKKHIVERAARWASDFVDWDSTKTTIGEDDAK